MRFWKLVSVLGGKTDGAIEAASRNEEWMKFAEWMDDFTQIVNSQDRAKLDFELPDAFVRNA